jgi:hypothetical protein
MGGGFGGVLLGATINARGFAFFGFGVYLLGAAIFLAINLVGVGRRPR